MADQTLLVTGASGQLGRLVLDQLLSVGQRSIVATTRNPDSLASYAARGVTVRRADFDDETSLAEAFRGAQRALLISTDAVDRPGRRLEQHRRAIAALQRAGVKHVVYTSLPSPQGSVCLIAPDHAGTEAALEQSSIDYTILRNNLYADLLLGSLPGAIASGTLVDSRGSSAVAWVTRRDCARAAASALASSATGRRTLDVTGPQALTSDEMAAIASRVAGKQVAHLDVPPAAYIEGMTGHGVPAPVAALFASFDAAAKKGDYANVTTTVTDMTSVVPTSVEAFLLEHRGALTSPA